MAEPVTLAATPTRIALLIDVDNGLVKDREGDFVPVLDIGEDGVTRVAEAIWLMQKAGWVQQVHMDHRWTLTPLGRDVLDSGGTNA